ncbi:MAG: hypothetical protein GC190_19230 [Alphaproteobacteria bacterium]|nr:hypothetical protein [Alphaproteobacteria bacterium]
MATDVRKPPLTEIFALHAPHAPGKCDWCGKPRSDRTPKRNALRKRHYACEDEITIICRPDVARRYVFDRDHGICFDCGEDWSQRYRFRKGADCVHAFDDAEICADGYASEEARELRRAGFYRSTEVLWISLWHVDHKTPLWKVAHMPPAKRINYFKLANMVTRCEPCHQRKSAKEAAERAKFNRHHSATEKKAKQKFGSRKMQSRPFPKIKRPMRRKP